MGSGTYTARGWECLVQPGANGDGGQAVRRRRDPLRVCPSGLNDSGTILPARGIAWIIHASIPTRSASEDCALPAYRSGFLADHDHEHEHMVPDIVPAEVSGSSSLRVRVLSGCQRAILSPKKAASI
jgi:hypothetical protein